VTAIFPWK